MGAESVEPEDLRLDPIATAGTNNLVTAGPRRSQLFSDVRSLTTAYQNFVLDEPLKLTDGLGLDRAFVKSLEGLLPATRFAVDAYVHFVREKSLLEAVASSLTELFSPTIIGERVEGMLRGYPFVTTETLAYFSARPPQAARDADFALDYVKCHAVSVESQQAVLSALSFKCDVLWAMLDALYHAYVAPKHVPPGAFVPSE